MRIVVEWTETIGRQSVIEADSVEEAERLIAEYDAEIVEQIEAVSVEVDGGGFTLAASYHAEVTS